MKKRRRSMANRDRDVKALKMRTAGATYEEIRVALNFRTVSAARMAINRLQDRVEADSVAERRAVADEQYRVLLAGVWPRATRGDDDGAIRTAARLVDSVVRLWGADAAHRLLVSAAVSEADFAEAARELLSVTGPGPLLELAKLPPAPGEPVVVDCISDGWANIGGPGIAVEDVTLEDVTPEAEPATVVVAERLVDDGQDDGVAEVVETVEAEVVVDNMGPRPAGQRTIRRGDPEFSEVLVPAADGTMIPMNRSGIGRRFGGYSPLAAWRP